MFCAFCRENTTADGRRFQHFLIYCLKDALALDSFMAVVNHIKDHGEQEDNLAMLCGECGCKFSTLALLESHASEKGFHVRKSKIRWYEKYSFDPWSHSCRHATSVAAPGTAAAAAESHDTENVSATVR